jgi:hypothetical protein
MHQISARTTGTVTRDGPIDQNGTVLFFQKKILARHIWPWESDYIRVLNLNGVYLTFTTLHTIQYSMQDHSDNNNHTTAQTTEDPDSTNFSASPSTHDTPASISAENIEKSSGRWTESEITLLLDYVETNCVLKTARGLNLKKSEFNKAHATVKSKDAAQCHYKWGHVCIFLYQVISTSVFMIKFHH